MELDWHHGELYEGRRCFDYGAYFEAHEHWELVWLTAPEPEKTFLQALIQVAASFHHFQHDNYAGTASLLQSALGRLETYPDTFAGVATEPLRAAIRIWLHSLGKGLPAELPAIPRLELTSVPPSAPTER